MEVTVTLAIKAQVAAQEEADYFLEPTTNTASIAVLADIVDCLDGIVFEKILTVNDKTPEQIQKEIQAPITLA